MKEIPLGNVSAVALVDDEHFEQLSRFNWTARKGSKGCLYAHTTAGRGRSGMHQMVAQICGFAGPLIDHANHNGLDNRSQNLRVCTHAQNAWNGLYSPGSSGHRGVCKNRSGWAVRFDHEGKRLYFGTHRDLETAKEIATREMKRLRGEFYTAAENA